VTDKERAALLVEKSRLYRKVSFSQDECDKLQARIDEIDKMLGPVVLSRKGVEA